MRRPGGNSRSLATDNPHVSVAAVHVALPGANVLLLLGTGEQRPDGAQVVGGELTRGHDWPIPGLYAIGNDQASMMGGHYPAGGVNIGPAMTLGYIAGRDLAGATDRTPNLAGGGSA